MESHLSERGPCLSKDQVVALILAVAEGAMAEKDRLNELDSVIGDGDLGVTLTVGFRAVKEALRDTAGLDIQGVLGNCGAAFADSAASTFGTLLATMFIRAGRAAKGKDAVGPAEAAAMMRAAAEGVEQRGKAALGQKTVLDALVPAAQALEEASAGGAGLAACLDAAAGAAAKGAEATAGMRSAAGRSAWFGDRTVGATDPGAVAFVLMLESAARFVGGPGGARHGYDRGAIDAAGPAT